VPECFSSQQKELASAESGANVVLEKPRARRILKTKSPRFDRPRGESSPAVAESEAEIRKGRFFLSRSPFQPATALSLDGIMSGAASPGYGVLRVSEQHEILAAGDLKAAEIGPRSD